MTASGPQARTRVITWQNDLVIDRNRNQCGEHDGVQLYYEFLIFARFFLRNFVRCMRFVADSMSSFLRVRECEKSLW